MICIGKSRKKGQAMVFFLIVLVILVFVVMWNFDLHKILFAKYVTQNAGDSVRLAEGLMNLSGNEIAQQRAPKATLIFTEHNILVVMDRYFGGI